MRYRLYSDLAAWWPHLSGRESLADEAQAQLRIIDDALGRTAKTLLELGAGGGLLAREMGADRDVVLTDLSAEMLHQSQKENPEREHIQGDMRTMRLGRTFDAVLLHDAVMYLTSPEDLAATFATAAAHLSEGGVLLVLPDVVKDTFEEGCISGGSIGSPAAQMLEWHWDPDPTDHTYRVDMCFMLRHENGEMETVHEHHEMGLFDRATFCQLIRDAGFDLVAGTVWEAVDLGEFFVAAKRSI